MEKYAIERGHIYRANCQNCSWTRTFGALIHRCELEAGKHARRYGSHRVAIEAVQVLRVFSGLDNMDQLPLEHDLDEPPF